MRRATALVELHAAVALFGFAALFGKWLQMAPATIVLGRTIVAAVALGIVLYVRGTRAGRPDVGLVVNGALLALHWVTFFAAVQVATVAIGLLGFAGFPIFVLILESVEARQRPSAHALAAVTLVAAGLLLLVPEFTWASRTIQGLVLGLLSGFTFALLALRNRARLAKRAATTLAMWQNAFAAAWLLPVVVLGGAASLPSSQGVALLVVLGVFCTALAHTLFIASMARLSAHTASVVSILEPVYGIALAALLLGERPDLRTLAGALLIVSAAALATRWASSD